MDYFSWLDPKPFFDKLKRAPDEAQYARLLAYQRHVEAERKLAAAQQALSTWNGTPP